MNELNAYDLHTTRPGTQPQADLTVGELARVWAAVASRTAYLPTSQEETERLLADLIERLVEVATAPQVDERAVMDLAARLVGHHLTGARSLGRSIELLGTGLPRLAALRRVGPGRAGPGRAGPGRAAGPDTAVLKVLAALADGFAEALRQRMFEEQGRINQALVRAKQDAERGLRASEARFREIFSASALGITISDLDGRLVEVNQAFADIVGQRPEDLVGRPLREVLRVRPDAEPDMDQGPEPDAGLDAEYQKLTSGERSRFRRRYRHVLADGDMGWIYLVGSLLRDSDGLPTHHITIAEDLTELQLLRRELSDQALHDKLTGLPNEHYFMSHLDEVLTRIGQLATVTVCRVNLDNFSLVSDGLGRQAGERLLCSVATRLLDLLGEERVMVARTGTDDFAILIEDGPATPPLDRLAAMINDELSEPVYLGDRGLAISAGVGVVRRRAGGISAAELVRAADATLHRAKRGGRGQWGLYDPQVDARDRDRYRLAAEMPGAHECGEISIEYQPLHKLRTGRVVALRTMLRWNRSDGTTVGHEECVALAAQTGLMRSLGSWVLRQACADRSRWRSPLDHVCLRVDLTASASCDPDLVAVVRGALSASRIPSDRVQIGVPLVALSGDPGEMLGEVPGEVPGEVVDNVQVLAELGVEILLLDAAAGAGYTAFLEDLPVTAVEFTPGMVSRIAARPGPDSLVARAARQAIPLVHSAGAKVVVPGVDTAEQARWWRHAGADTACGAYFGPPISADEVARLRF